MDVRLKAGWRDHRPGEVVKVDERTARALVAGNAGVYAETGGQLPPTASAAPARSPAVSRHIGKPAEKAGTPISAPVTKPADAAAMTEREKKRALADQIKRLGGTPPHHASGLDKFEAALTEARRAAAE